MSLNEIVKVSITKETTAISRVGFGTPLVVAYHNEFPERTRVYTSADEMLKEDPTDPTSPGFELTDPAYKAVNTIFAQNPSVKRVVVGRATRATPMKHKLTPVVKNKTLYEVTINGETVQYTSADTGATAEAIALGLTTAINLGSSPVTATNGTGTDAGSLTIEANTAGMIYTLEVNRSLIKQLNQTGYLLDTDEGIEHDLAEIRNENDEWYSVHLTSNGGDEILRAADYIKGIRKMLIVTSADDDILDSTITTDIGSMLKSLGYFRTTLLYHPKPHSFPDAAWAGVMLPKDPGSATWKFKNLAGIEPVKLTGQEETTLESKNVNYQTLVADVKITQQGKSTSGEFIDITRFVDFLQARLQENIFSRLANLDKIPFTDQGIAIIENEIRGVLQLGINVGGLAADPEPVISVPRATAVPFAERANRLLPDVTFRATLAGAIHALEIQGTVSV